MGIQVQHEPPISLTGQLALATGAAQGETKRREAEAEREDRRRELALKLRQQAWENQQNLLAGLQQQQMRAAASQAELGQQLQSREAIAQAQIEQQQQEAELRGLKEGTLKYTPVQKRQLDDVDASAQDILTNPKFGPVGQAMHPLRQAALERAQARRAMIRPVPTPADEQPQKMRWVDDKEYGVSEILEHPGYGWGQVQRNRTGELVWKPFSSPDKTPQYLQAELDRTRATDQAKVQQIEAKTAGEQLKIAAEQAQKRADFEIKAQEAAFKRQEAAQKSQEESLQRHREARFREYERDVDAWERLNDYDKQGKPRPDWNPGQVDLEWEQQQARLGAAFGRPFQMLSPPQPPKIAPPGPIPFLGRRMTEAEETQFRGYLSGLPSGSIVFNPETGEKIIRP